MLIQSVLSADRYCIKYLITPSGGTGGLEDDVTIINADLLADMVDGPLRDLFVKPYASLALARADTLEGVHMEAGLYPRGTVLPSTDAAQWGLDITLAGTAAGITVYGNNYATPYVLTLQYRHSTGR